MTARTKTKTPVAQAAAVPAGVAIVGSTLRSTNLERDLAVSDLSHFHVGARALDLLDRIASAVEDSGRTRAWSLTGPYGSGKSTLASLIAGLLGPSGERLDSALAQVRERSAALADRLEASRASGGHAAAGPDGMLLAVVSARQEPLAVTVRRALHNAVEQRWPDPATTPREVNAALSRFNRPESGSADVLAAVAALCAVSPVMLVIDEFGKTLEFLLSRGGSGAAADLYLLQELAEKGAGRNGLPLFLFTLQHLSFGDYAAHAGSVQTREWAKIQGRFEDVTFVPDLGDTVQLLRRSLDHDGVDDAGQKALAAYDTACADAWAQLGLDGVLTPERGLFADLYPLHPATAVAAPLLAAQVGQHDRSLAGFLAADEPHSVTRFITAHAAAGPARLATVRLAQLYDYFLASGRTTILASVNASRWLEIDMQMQEAHGLDEADKAVLKTVALLNLIDSAGALRASHAMIMFALADPSQTATEADSKKVEQILADLIKGGFLVYREFADEYRVWRGTDIDIKARIEEVWARGDDNNSALTVVTRHLPPAIVAGRHSQQTGMLRYFTTLATDGMTETVTGPAVGEAADGLLVFHLGDHDDIPKIRSCKPVVVGTTKKSLAVLEAARYVYALEALLDDKEITADIVAKREVAERLSQAASDLASRLAEAFSPMQPNSHWALYRPEGADADTAGVHEQLRGRSFASIVSAACEVIFPFAPHIRNEMLGRDQLTSQGARALRDLLTAMVQHPFERYLGMTGYGPERAMYHGVLEYLGLHRISTEPGDPTGGELVPFAFAEPDQSSPAHPVWTALNDALSAAAEQTTLEEIMQVMSAPPYGVKAGVIPILLTTALLIRSEDIALFRNGTYQPQLKVEVVELMRASPRDFTVKATPTGKGQRKAILDLLADGLAAGPVRASRTMRNPAVLTVTRALLDHARTISPYARRTKRISPQAQAVRAALVESNDPVALIFDDLPKAVGFDPVDAGAKLDRKTAASYTGAAVEALRELRDADSALRTSAIEAVATAFRLPATLGEVRAGLAAATTGFANANLTSDLRGFVLIATNTALPDEDWLDPLLTRITGAPLGEWTDTIAEGLGKSAAYFASALDRLGHLYEADTATESPTAGAIPVQAQLVTITSPAGTESRTLVRVPASARTKAAELARRVVALAEKELGPDGGRILLAALAEQLTGSSDDSGSIDTQQTTTAP